jgi:hypothetical protein
MRPKSIHANHVNDVDRRRPDRAAIAPPISSAEGRLQPALRYGMSF